MPVAKKSFSISYICFALDPATILGFSYLRIEIIHFIMLRPKFPRNKKPIITHLQTVLDTVHVQREFAISGGFKQSFYYYLVE